MTEPASWQQRAREALERTEIMVLATADAESGSWTSPVQFQAGGNFELSFLSRPGTRHGRNIDRDPRVAAAVYSWPGPDGGNLGLQITGHATRKAMPPLAGSGTRSARPRCGASTRG
jgi:Pyridoxamine 5'-phosphate oxidase